MGVQKIEISNTTLLKILLFVVLAWLTFYLRDVILLLFVSFIFMSAFNPWVDKLERGKVPRWLAVLFFYLLFFGASFAILANVLPPLVQQNQDFLRSLPNLAREFFEGLKLTGLVNEEAWPSLIDSLAQNLSNQIIFAPEGIFRFGASILGTFWSIVSFWVVTFYLLLGHKSLKFALSRFLHAKHQDQFLEGVEKVEKKLGAWLRGQLFLMFLIGFLTYLGLNFLIRIPFALPLAIVAGLLEIIPIIGPIVSAVPAIIVAAAFSPWKILSVILLYTLIQQLENSLIVPNVMKKAVGLNPLLVLLALIVGGKLSGPLGALLSVPILAVVVILLQEFKSLEKGGE